MFGDIYEQEDSYCLVDPYIYRETIKTFEGKGIIKLIDRSEVGYYFNTI